MWVNRGSFILLVAGILLLAVWFASPTVVAPPLYDGLQLPPQPYRYLNPPAGARNPGPPSRGHLRVTLSGPSISFQDIATLETPPQARLVLQDKAFSIPKSDREVTFSIDAISPPAAPKGGTIDGNVYRFLAVANNGSNLTLRKQQARVELRGTGERGSPMVEENDHGRWVKLATGKFLGLDIFVASINRLGDYALVIPGQANGSTGGNSPLPFIIAGFLIVAVAVAGLLLVRLSRTRGSPASPPSA
jgi:hypothetical protein